MVIITVIAIPHNMARTRSTSPARRGVSKVAAGTRAGRTARHPGLSAVTPNGGTNGEGDGKGTSATGTVTSSSPTAIFIASLPPSALLVLAVLHAVPCLVDGPHTTMATAVGVMTVVISAIYSTVVALGHTPSLLGVFLCVSTFTAAIDLGITMHLVGIWEPGKFYLVHGERYFDSAYGVACLGWDGVFHTGIQGLLAFRSLTGGDMKPFGLVWAGSIIFSMMPLLIGSAATGKYSDIVELSTAMNAPYVIIPIALCYQLFESATGTPRRGRARRRGSSSQPDPEMAAAGIGAAAASAAMVLLHTLQAMAVLGSKAKVARWWVTDVEPVLAQSDGTNAVLIGVMQYFFYCVPLHCLVIWEWTCRLWWRRLGPMGNGTDWSALLLGFYLQGMFVSTTMATVQYHGPGELTFTSHLPTMGVAAFTLAAASIQLIAFTMWDATN